MILPRSYSVILRLFYLYLYNQQNSMMKRFFRVLSVVLGGVFLSTLTICAKEVKRKPGASVSMNDKSRKELLSAGVKQKQGYYAISFVTEYSPKQLEKVGQKEGHYKGLENGEVALLKSSDVFYLWRSQSRDRISGSDKTRFDDVLYYLPADDLGEILPESTVAPSLMNNQGSCRFIDIGWRQEGFSTISGFQWSGDVSEGYLDGSGEGYSVRKIGDHRYLFFVKGTFKQGMPAGVCDFVKIRVSGKELERYALHLYNDEDYKQVDRKDYSDFFIFNQQTGRPQKCTKYPGPFYVTYDLDDDGKVAGLSEESLKEVEDLADSFLSLMTNRYNVASFRKIEAEAEKVRPMVGSIDYYGFTTLCHNLHNMLSEGTPLREKIDAILLLDKLYTSFQLPNYYVSGVLDMLERASTSFPENLSPQKVQNAYYFHKTHPITRDYDSLLKNPYFTQKGDTETEKVVREHFAKKNKVVDDAYENCLAIAERREEKYYRDQQKYNYSHNVIDRKKSVAPHGEIKQYSSLLGGSWCTYDIDGVFYFKDEDSSCRVTYNIIYDPDMTFRYYSIRTPTTLAVGGSFENYDKMVDAIERAYSEYKKSH